MSDRHSTVIVTGASQGIGAGVTQSFLERGYNVVANSRNIRKSGAFVESDHLALVDGDRRSKFYRFEDRRGGCPKVWIHRRTGQQCGHYLRKTLH